MHNITVIPGDGVGPEITQAAIEVLNATGVSIKWHTYLAGDAAKQEYGSALPSETIRSIRDNGVAIKGPLAVEKGQGTIQIQTTNGSIKTYNSINNAIRREIEAYANVRPMRCLEGVPTRYDNVNLVVIREITEDIYIGHEHMVGDCGAQAVKVITRRACTRVARFSFEYARKLGRKKISAVHKANALSLTDGLFLESVRAVAEEYPDIIFDDLMVDNTCYQLVRNPEIFDILLAPNQYGDILADLCAGIVGSLGIAPGVNIGDMAACFEPAHGTAPDIAGKNIANPLSSILSGAMMLDYLNEKEASDRVWKAVIHILKDGRNLTPDLGGNGTTTRLTNSIIEALEIEQI
jgi:isocitrate dehydrogenase (NAD+)